MSNFKIGVVVVLVILLALYVWDRKSIDADVEEAGDEAYDFVFGTDGSGKSASRSCPSIAEQAAAHRAWQNDQLACRTGVPNYTAGYGAQRSAHPHDCPVRTRNGHYMHPSKIAGAEQQAWAPYTPDTPGGYDPTHGSYPGTDLTQQLGCHQVGDWGEQLTSLAIDPRTRENHRQWANEVAPFSQGAFTVDNHDEAVVMSQPRVGITAFRALTPAQGPATLHLTEIDPTHHAEHFKKFQF